MVANHVLLFDSAYARRAEKAGHPIAYSVYEGCKKNLGPTTRRN